MLGRYFTEAKVPQGAVHPTPAPTEVCGGKGGETVRRMLLLFVAWRWLVLELVWWLVGGVGC